MGHKARALSPEEALHAYRYLSGYRDRVMFGVMVLAGARVGEAVGLDLADAFDDDGHVLQFLDIRNEIAKKGHGGLIPIGPDLAQLLAPYWHTLEDRSPRAPLVQSRKRGQDGGRRLHRSAAWRRLSRAFERAALPGASPHSLRKTFFALLMSRGVQIDVAQTLMRHKSLKTADHYAREVAEHELRTAMSGLGYPLFSLSPPF